MKTTSVLKRFAVAVGGLSLFVAGCAEAPEAVSYDIVVYGGSSAGIAAAVQAKRMGKSCVVIEPSNRIGGLTTGGLGQTDVGSTACVGGIAREFYKAVHDHYMDEKNWTWQALKDYAPDGQCSGLMKADTMWTFEPSAALGILLDWVKRDGLKIVYGERLNRETGVAKDGARITSIAMESGKTFAGKTFVDATYEGDLLAAAGVSYVVGREPNAQYDEVISGIQHTAMGAQNHQPYPGVDPWKVRGDASSGPLPGVEPYNPDEKEGDGDKRVQAYCFRMCLTDVKENQIPFVKPAGYDEADYELLFRNMEVLASDPKKYGGWTKGVPWINSKMPNRKTDTNNCLGFSTDFIGQNWDWPDGSYATRDKILAAHLKYQQGLMWTLANHPRIPDFVREEVSKWGTCKDEFKDGLGNGWQGQLYVREARRMVGEYVMTEHNCKRKTVAPKSIACASYGMDSHHVRRVVGKDGFYHNEGNVEDWSMKGKPYPVGYGAIVPKKGECENLLVGICLSATHSAYGSIRMEPVFFELGQVCATAAAFAIDANCAVQDVDYAKLAARLTADGQILSSDEAVR